MAQTFDLHLALNTTDSASEPLAVGDFNRATIDIDINETLYTWGTTVVALQWATVLRDQENTHWHAFPTPITLSGSTTAKLNANITGAPYIRLAVTTAGGSDPNAHAVIVLSKDVNSA